jgi:hypothetical protein
MYLLKRNQKKFIVLIALVYLISGITIGFHHHADGNGRHSDCPICTNGNLFSAIAGEAMNSLDVYLRITHFCRSEENCTATLSTFSVHAPRAPPADPIT